MAKKRALLVAIDDYPGTRNDLPSCVADLTAMEATIADNYGFADIKKLTNADATLANVETELKALFKDAASDDQLFFFFSGHGSQTPVAGEYQESLVCHDGFFPDDKLVQLASALPIGVATFVIDACHSGGLEKRFYEFVDYQEEIARIKVWMPDDMEKFVSEAIKNDKAIIRYRPFGCFPIETKWTPKAMRKALNKPITDDDEAGQPRFNGTLITACLENETASASTLATMNVFTKPRELILAV